MSIYIAVLFVGSKRRGIVSASLCVACSSNIAMLILCNVLLWEVAYKASFCNTHSVGGNN